MRSLHRRKPYDSNGRTLGLGEAKTPGFVSYRTTLNKWRKLAISPPTILLRGQRPSRSSQAQSATNSVRNCAKFWVSKPLDWFCSNAFGSKCGPCGTPNLFSDLEKQ